MGLNFRDYEQKLTWPGPDTPVGDRQAMRLAYQAEAGALLKRFKADALEDLGLTGHPKADKLFEVAWQFGHANGIHEVFLCMDAMADLLR